jgi:SAM-dependent methyltransferase
VTFTMPPRAGAVDAFDAALAGADTRLISAEGHVLSSAVARWHGPADPGDQWLLQRCVGPTVDLGCGPGRLVAALTERGVPSLGIDSSPIAVRECRARGGQAVRSDVFTALPGEGRWQHALLADGNIGIGGDPSALLRRCARLIRPGGTLLVETTPDTAVHGLWRGSARVHHTDTNLPAGPWFRWALADLHTVTVLARDTGLHPIDRHQGARCFLQLHRPHPGSTHRGS